MELQAAADDHNRKSVLEEYLAKVRTTLDQSDLKGRTRTPSISYLEKEIKDWRISIAKVGGHLSRLLEKAELKQVHESRQDKPLTEHRLSALTRSTESNARYEKFIRLMNALKSEFTLIEPLEAKRCVLSNQLLKLDEELETYQKAHSKLQLEVNRVRKETLMISRFQF